MKRPKCPRCGSGQRFAYQNEVDPIRVYECTSCSFVYHPPGCKCGKCPR